MLRRTDDGGVVCTECRCTWEPATGGACDCGATTDLVERDGDARICRACLTFKGDGVSHANVCDGPDEPVCEGCGKVGTANDCKDVNGAMMCSDCRATRKAEQRQEMEANAGFYARSLHLDVARYGDSMTPQERDVVTRAVAALEALSESMRTR